MSAFLTLQNCIHRERDFAISCTARNADHSTTVASYSVLCFAHFKCYKLATWGVSCLFLFLSCRFKNHQSLAKQ